MMMKDLVKIVVFVPKKHADLVRKAIGDTGGGSSGNYSYCSFSSDGIGRFKPLYGAKPTIGEIGKLEEVLEERVEFICLKTNAKEIISAIKKVHPYEEVAFDIYPLISENEL